METISNWLTRDPVAIILAVALNVTAFAIGVVGLLLARRRSRIRWSKVQLWKEPGGDRVTRILLWNGGSTTLRASDFAPLAPLTVSVDGGEIKAKRITAVTRPWCNVQVVEPDAATAQITFDFLGRKDGCVITIWHDAGTSLLVAGVLMDGGLVAPGLDHADFDWSGFFFRIVLEPAILIVSSLQRTSFENDPVKAVSLVALSVLAGSVAASTVRRIPPRALRRAARSGRPTWRRS
ncbi:MAG: hypothetical protein QOE90_2639 [Thermoplasmata archaeon]|nr:hypothetical protein [Thermoplasmata archaeon]